ncbi:AraC family transcriptional regulator [Desulfitobacterium hafniense]|uniref:Transcriptional regulator, effector binding domain protein n=1 Tax=Desulfitobacterium hafniense DP7 TaxID=537010 RepID=G9XKL0_DESHA|nr:transcriptional regulator, effector binding domain protein [Desulfitobacterium hafniense DP7]
MAVDYREALEQAVIYIEDHLGGDIKVEEVAGAAGYSYYHLNRQFTAVLGESIGSYIKKRRLAEAAKKLLYTDRKIIDIAMANGFDSPEAFSRAFKAVYKVSPQIYRQNRLDTFIAGKERLDAGLLEHLACNVTVHPQIVELPEIKVAGLRGETTLRDNRLRELWERANALYPQIPNRIPQGRAFGICEACAENTLYTMNEDILFTEVAGTEVSSFAGLTEPFVAKVIPGGRYAVFTHRGTLGRLLQTFDYIWGTWFLTTKEELDWREDFELYDGRFLGYDHPGSEVDLYIPIR